MSENVEKKKKPIKMYVILGSVVLFIILLIVANVDTARKEKAAQESSQAQQQAVVPDTNTDIGSSELYQPQEQLSEAELLQQALIEVFGEPPVGFRWGESGDLVPISDESLTSEEVAWRYLQALSNKDFATAQKYAQSGRCVDTYNSFYGTDAYATSDLIRGIYSEALGSLEFNGCKQNGVFANGRFVFTFTANMIDLSNKTFWEENSEEVFDTLRSYLVYENDSLKAENYVNELILQYYQSGEAETKEVKFDIVIDKVRLGGYLVSDDSSLDSICRYMNGTSVYQYIMEKYAEWISDASNNQDTEEA